MGPVGHIPNPLWLTVAADGTLAAQFPFVDGTLNYTRFEAKPNADPPTLNVEFVDGDGNVFHSETLAGTPVP